MNKYLIPSVFLAILIPTTALQGCANGQVVQQTVNKSVAVNKGLATEKPFAVTKACDVKSCILYRELATDKEQLATFDATIFTDKLSDITQIDDGLYYFHVSCGSACGYGHYVDRQDYLVTNDNEVLVDKQQQCVIYIDNDLQQVISYRFNQQPDKKRKRVIYDFNAENSETSHNKSFDNSSEYEEILNTAPLHQVFKEDAELDSKGVLHLYAFGKQNSLINLTIANAWD